MQADIALQQTHLTALAPTSPRASRRRGGCGSSRPRSTDLEHRLESLRNVLPEQKDVADTLRRIQGLATQSNLTLLRFTPAAQKQQPLYAEVPYQLTADGTYHNLALFFDRVSKFPRIINVGDISMTAQPAAGRPTRRSSPTAPRRPSCCRKRRAGEGAAPRRRRDDHDPDPREVGDRDGGAGCPAAAPAAAQVPNPTPAINAAKNARAKTEAAQQKNAEALDPQRPAPAAPAQPPATPPQPRRRPRAAASGAAPAQTAGGAGYSYDPAGRRDPFVSLSGRGGDLPDAGGTRPSGLAGAARERNHAEGRAQVAQGGFIALVQAPDNRTYIVHAGDKVFDGSVKAITADGVVFSQDVNDPLSLVKQREVRKAIRPEAR